MKRHPFDPVSFVMGVLFVLIAWSFLPGDRSVADLSPAWFWVAPLLGLSLLVVLTSLRRALARPDDEPDRPEEGHATGAARSPSRGPSG